ncbi:hypothetical protein SDC9_201537 [bioreactor metagenome]|uniref:Uncharacterized protein n=1 Tax=bioreactor metagenome TaxID=1076179 RepID=A0A645ITZ0_9ZZZZ
MEALPLPHAPERNVVVLLGGVVRPGLLRQYEVGLNDVGNVPEHQRGALLAVVRGAQLDRRHRLPLHRGLRWLRGLRAHLVAPDVVEADLIEHRDAVHHPADRRLPVDRVQHAAGRRGRHHVVADALGLHLRPREAGVFAPDLQSNAIAQALVLLSSDVKQVIVVASFVDVQ